MYGVEHTQKFMLIILTVGRSGDGLTKKPTLAVCGSVAVKCILTGATTGLDSDRLLTYTFQFIVHRSACHNQQLMLCLCKARSFELGTLGGRGGIPCLSQILTARSLLTL
jgi:hypothetical protein